MGATAGAAQGARARARAAQAQLRAERVERDKRVEDATTAAYAALDARQAALASVERAEGELVSALEQLRAEDEPLANIATLTGLAVSEVRRLLSGQGKKPARPPAGQLPEAHHSQAPASDGQPSAMAG